MPLNTTCDLLVKELEALPKLDNRFESIKLVNYNSVSDTTRGCFSLVFSAYDSDSKRTVALKFFDPERVLDSYRLDAFRREHQILKGLIGIARCLQLASDLMQYSLNVPIAAGRTIPIKCEYFAIDWVEHEIDRYFFCQEKFLAIKKLELFLSLASSVEALHNQDVFHRDLKPDNLRRHAALGSVPGDVVAIDLGTAAKLTSSHLMSNYGNSVGAPGYAAPETHCGLAGNRKIARFTDLFSLGCMLFELFNLDYFFSAWLKANPNIRMYLGAMKSGIPFGAGDVQQLKEWDSLLSKMSLSVVPVLIDGPGSDVPLGIRSLLNEVCTGLTHLDYRKRPSITWVRARIRSTIKVLENEHLYQMKLERARLIRARKVAKAQAQQTRIDLAQKRSMKGLKC